MGTAGTAPPVRRVPDGLKKKYQPVADAVATFGLRAVEWFHPYAARHPDSRRGYECACGLFFLRGRIESRRAFAFAQSVADGIGAAMTGEIPEKYFIAMSESEEDGRAIYNLHQSRVAFARRKAETSLGEGG